MTDALSPSGKVRRSAALPDVAARGTSHACPWITLALLRSGHGMLGSLAHCGAPAGQYVHRTTWFGHTRKLTPSAWWCQNDENLVIVEGHARLAQAYAAHVPDVTNHFAWRSKLAYLYKQGKLENAWGDLAETDRWQNKYFDGAEPASRDAFFFVE